VAALQFTPATVTSALGTGHRPSAQLRTRGVALVACIAERCRVVPEQGSRTILRHPQACSWVAPFGGNQSFRRLDR
jgi:hypothetical protein